MTTALPRMDQAPAAARVGRIHSVESCGAVDGPGLRCVIFTQGCRMRCRYCHNPDTWALHAGREVAVGELLADIRSYLPFMQASGGGVTVSGGEPLLQPAFVAGLFAECHRLGIHTALDTAGYAEPEEALPVLAETDLVLLDIKHADPVKHRALTGVDPDRPRRIAHLAAGLGKPIWIRYVVVPGWTDAPEDVDALAGLVGDLPTVEKVELLPYHLLGRHKWEVMGIPYTLEGVASPPPATLERIRQQLAQRGLRAD